MISFGILKEKVFETINKICKLFKTSEDYTQLIKTNVDEFTKSNEKKVKNEIIDENIGSLLNNHNDLQMVKNLIKDLKNFIQIF